MDGFETPYDDDAEFIECTVRWLTLTVTGILDMETKRGLHVLGYSRPENVNCHLFSLCVIMLLQDVSDTFLLKISK